MAGQFQPQPDILAHRAPGQQAELLEDHGDTFAADAAQVFAVGRTDFAAPAHVIDGDGTSPRQTGFRPLTARRSVDLPDPDRPISTRISPARTASEQSCTPSTCPVALDFGRGSCP
jgi:hypothetical protein